MQSSPVKKNTNTEEICVADILLDVSGILGLQFVAVQQVCATEYVYFTVGSRCERCP